MVDVPYRTVLEWEFFPPKQPPGVACLFATGGGYFVGWYCSDGSVYSENRKSSSPHMERLDEHEQSVITMLAPLPRDLCEAIRWNLQHAKELDLSQEAPGSDKVIGLVRSPRRGKVEMRLLDRQVTAALNMELTYEQFLDRAKLRRDTPRERVARQLWSIRTGCSKPES